MVMTSATGFCIIKDSFGSNSWGVTGELPGEIAVSLLSIVGVGSSEASEPSLASKNEVSDSAGLGVDRDGLTRFGNVS